jgi:hypothetical protein
VATQRASVAESQAPSHGSLLTVPYTSYQPRHDYGAWAYQGEASRFQSGWYTTSSGLRQNSHTGHYRDSPSTSVSSKPFNDAATQYRARLQWQRPYTGPSTSTLESSFGMVPDVPLSGNPSEKSSHPTLESSSQLSISWSNPGPSSTDAPYSQTTANVNQTQPSSQLTSDSADIAPETFKDFSLLPVLQPTQIASILRSHPELRDAVWAAVDRQKSAGP